MAYINNTQKALQEHKHIISALYQWMESQNIPRKQWGLIFAKAAGYEVSLVTKDQINLKLGASILCAVLSLHADGSTNG